MLQSLKKIIVFRALIFAKIKELGKEKEAGKESDITESLRRENAEIRVCCCVVIKELSPFSVRVTKLY